jgi:hypothetical protein
MVDYRDMGTSTIDNKSGWLKNAITKKWPEAIRSLGRRSGLYFPTGLAELDNLFPSGRGIPYGQLIEITGGPSSGKTSLLFRLLASAGRPRRTVAYVDFDGAFFPEAAASAGVDLKRLLVIRPETGRQVTSPTGSGNQNLTEQPAVDNNAPAYTRGRHMSTCAELPGRCGHRPRTKCDPAGQLRQNLRAAELLLRDRHADIIVLDLVGQKQPLSLGLLHRLRLRTVRAKSLVIFLTEKRPNDIIPSSMASLRLEVGRIDDTGRFRIVVTKSRICPEGIRLEVTL